jgi:RNA polymerase sigma-70 factor, ECF subfamily
LGRFVDYKKIDDVQLIQWIARSNSDALGELYDRYSRLVFGVALKTIGDQALAEEITQDVFMRVWERASTYQAEHGKVAGWVASIARNRAIDVYRHRQSSSEGRSTSLDDLLDFDPPDSQNVEREVELGSQRQRLRQALFELPKEQRQALALAYFRGYSHDEVAKALGEPLGTVKTRIRLGMQKLRQIFDDETG